MSGLRSMMNADHDIDTVTATPEPQAGRREPQPFEPEIRDESYQLLEKSLPPRTALLYVVDSAEPAGGPGRFHLRFHFQGNCLESDTSDQIDIGVSLYRVANERTWKRDFFLIRNWWKEMVQLRNWMTELDAAGPDVRLLVWDTMTDAQIPWELYYLDRSDDDPRSGWVGSHVEIIRWTSILPGREPHFTGEKNDSRGSMLLMETPDVTDSGDGVADLLEESDLPALNGMPDLLDQLRRAELRFGLLLMHCRGINATNASEFELGGHTLNEMDAELMPAIAGSKPIVVLNACNTARAVPVGPGSSIASRSFAELFLRKGAATVVATLGNIGLDHTREFVFQLLKAKGDDRRIARFLQVHRKRYADKINRDSTPGDYEAFFYSFMYVCFGHPDTTMHLGPEEPPA